MAETSNCKLYRFMIRELQSWPHYFLSSTYIHAIIHGPLNLGASSNYEKLPMIIDGLLQVEKMFSEIKDKKKLCTHAHDGKAFGEFYQNTMRKYFKNYNRNIIAKSFYKYYSTRRSYSYCLYDDNTINFYVTNLMVEINDAIKLFSINVINNPHLKGHLPKKTIGSF